jgi:hypothetical protein
MNLQEALDIQQRVDALNEEKGGIEEGYTL